MRHFTSKAYLVTYEQCVSYDRIYGVECICNKRSSANIKLAELEKNKTPYSRVIYKVVEVDLDKGAELFQFNY